MTRPGGLDLGARPPRGGTLLVVVGAVLLLAGVVVGLVGIARSVDSHGEIAGSAVARGTVMAGVGEPVTFEGGDTEKLTVYLDFDGVTGDALEQERAVGATACEVVTDTGGTVAFAGSRQGTATTLGDYLSVGTFPAGTGEIRCGYTTRASGSGVLPESIPFLVTPADGTSAVWPVTMILGGVALGLLGGWLGTIGLGRRRRAARLRGAGGA